MRISFKGPDGGPTLKPDHIFWLIAFTITLITLIAVIKY